VPSGRFVRVDEPGQRRGLAAVHGGPEPGVSGVAGRLLGGRLVCQPVVLPLEGIGRQVSEAAGGQRPGGRDARDMKFGGAEQQPIQPTVVAAQRADRCRVDGGHQHRVRRHLQQNAAVQLPHGRGELHRPAQVREPVLGVQFGGVHPRVARRRVEAGPARGRADAGQRRQQAVPHHLHVRGV
jgi:hypothetical protein